MAASTQTQAQGQNVSDVVGLSTSDKPAKSRDDLLKQIKELNRALSLSEEAVSTTHC